MKMHKKMVHPEGLEPTTFCSEDRRSNPLSYGCTHFYYNIISFFTQSLHQSWGILMFAIGIIFGCILGVVFRVNYFANFMWIVFVGLILVIMYLKPKLLTVGMCLIAGMVLVFFRIAGVIGSEAGMKDLNTLDAEPASMIIDVRDWFAERVREAVPEPEVKLGLSYLLGTKDDLPKDLKENLKMVGLIHIVVASGAHLAILVEFARKIFGRISRFSGLFFSILFILIFMSMVGFSPSILRAGVMAILTLISWYVGRKITPIRLIIMVAAFTLMLNPLFLTNLGWLLSFASYAGIMLVMPIFTKFFYGEKKPKFVASVILATLSATIMTLPITLYYFGQVSIISVVANLLILPTLPYAMVLVFLSGVLAGVPLVSAVVGFLTTKLLDFHVFVVSTFASMEQFLIKIDTYNPWVFLMYIPIVGLIIFGGIWEIKKRRGVRLVGARDRG